MILNNNIITTNKSNYNFSFPAVHKIDFLMNISSLNSLGEMFNKINKMISIYFRSDKLSSTDVLFFDTSKVTNLKSYICRL